MPTPISSIVAALESAGISGGGGADQQPILDAIATAQSAVCTALQPASSGTIHTTYVNANTAGPTSLTIPGTELLAVIVSTEQNTVINLEAQTAPGVWSVVAVVANTTYRCWGLTFPHPVPFASLRYSKSVGAAGACHVTFWTRSFN